MEDDIRSAVDETGTEVNPEANGGADSSAGSVDAGERWAKEKAELEDLLRRRQAEFEN